MNEILRPKPARPVGERRKHQRYYVDLPLDYRAVENKKKGPIQGGTTRNLGIGGFSISLKERIPPGKRLLIELYYNDSSRFASLKIMTEVIWSSGETEDIGFKHGLKSLLLEKGGNAKLLSILKRCPLPM